MRPKCVICLSMLAVLAAGCSWGGLSRAEREKLVPGPAPNRVVQLDLRATLKDVPADGRELRLWMPLIQSDAHQTITERRILAPLRPMVRYDVVFTNAMMYFTGDEPLPTVVNARLTFRIELHRCPPADVVGTAPLTPEQLAELTVFLQTTDKEEALKQGLAVLEDRVAHERPQDRPLLEAEQTKMNESYTRLAAGNVSLREVAVSLRDAGLSPRSQTRRVYDFVREKLGIAGDPVQADRTLFEAWQSAQVTPLEYARITVFFLRTLGVPARVEYGVDLGGSESDQAPLAGSADISIWVGAFLSPGFWFPIDPVAAEARPELGDYYFGTDCASRIRFGWGSGINLVPQQIGEPLPIFVNAYAEVDDKTLPVDFAVSVEDLLTRAPVEKKK